MEKMVSVVDMHIAEVQGESRRIDWIDIAKGYGMIMVILAHLGVGVIGFWIYSFHMPLFFFLSGFVFSDKYSFGTFLKKKITKIIIPYFSLGVPLVIYEIIGDSLENVGEGINKNIVWDHIQNLLAQKRWWPLWFLTCLFFLNIIFYALTHLCKSNEQLCAMVFILTVLGLTYYKLDGKPLVWNIDICFTALPFFYVGYYLKNNYARSDEMSFTKTRWIRAFVICMVINILTLGAGWGISGNVGFVLEMAGQTYSYEPLVYLGAFAGIFGTIIFSCLVKNRFVRYIGKNSIIYLAWHHPIFIRLSDKILKMMGFSYKEGHDRLVELIYKFGYKLLQLIMILAIITFLNELISKSKLKFMVGK